MNSFAKAEKFVNGGRYHKQGFRRVRGIAATVIYRAPSSYYMEYCGTELVRWYRDGSIRIQDDGWRTSTTTRRINDFTGNGVWSWCESGMRLVSVPPGKIVKYGELGVLKNNLSPTRYIYLVLNDYITFNYEPFHEMANEIVNGTTA